MKFAATALMTACLSFTGVAMAQDAMKKNDTMAKEPMMKKEMSTDECKDHMAMAHKDGMKKDDMAMKKDAACADMMKKDAMGKDPMMKKDGMAEPMKK